jgi:hypothetical protein
MNLARDVIELLEARASNGRSAFHYVETLFTRIVAALRRDPRLRSRSKQRIPAKQDPPPAGSGIT